VQNIKRKSKLAQRGGNRKGAGRPTGAVNRATAEQKARLSEIAREYTEIAFSTLVEVAQSGQSDTARISAACAILDRGFGKPREAGQDEYSQPGPFDFLDIR